MNKPTTTQKSKFLTLEFIQFSLADRESPRVLNRGDVNTGLFALTIT
jgi:hypothetical protein